MKFFHFRAASSTPKEIGYFLPAPLIQRQRLFENYLSQLEQRNIAVLKGLSGTGKSVLAAQLLRYIPRKRKLWLSLRQDWNDSLEVIAWEVGDLLAKEGYSATSQYLEQQDRLPRPYPIRIRLGHVLDDLLKLSTLLCVDNYEVIDANPAMRAFFEEIRDHIEKRSDCPLQLVITTTVEPQFLYDFGNQPLMGFSETETTEFLDAHDLQLSAEEISYLWVQISGLPCLLQWFVSWQHQQANRHSVQDFLNEMDYDFTWQQFLGHLSHSELGLPTWRLLEILAILPNPTSYITLRDKICIAEDNIPDIGHILHRLFCRYMIERAGSNGQLVTLPQVLRHFYSQQVNEEVQKRIELKIAGTQVPN